MQASKIRLSEEELNLVKNSEWILTKNRIIKKVIAGFAELATDLEAVAYAYDGYLPAETFDIPPKIYKGEQHLGLPYVMLDYPRIFSKEDAFAIRTFFWWGNFFSLTLHLKGVYKNRFENAIRENADLLRGKFFFYQYFI